MSEERYVKIKVRKFNLSEKFSIGEYVEWNNIVYKFLGYEYGTYPVVEDIETGETKTLPHI